MHRPLMNPIAARVLQAISDIREAARLPSITVSLMREAAKENHPFFLRCVDEFYTDCVKRHPRFPLVRNYEYGVAICLLPSTADIYVSSIEASARRNVKKAGRAGYHFARMNYNDWLPDIARIRRSATVRQG